MPDKIPLRAIDAKRALKKIADPEKAKVLRGFFKTGKGEYGAGDKFLGVVVPKIRTITQEFKNLSPEEVSKLLQSKYHEERLTALLILVLKFKSADEKGKREIFNLYNRNIKQINNWDLVDLTAPNIIGEYLKKKDRLLLYKYAKSEDLWERRIAIISTFTFIKDGDCEDTLKISEKLLKDKSDLIHKACGWMLREVGKRCGENIEEEFLQKHHKTMPRTMLRYAIERLPEEKRQLYLKK
ncbi:MAG: alkylation repair enzyme protein [Parcubacteria group bacterium GW2011_GWF2_38_76]|nr:MAG: alkylation repair enzyme protein [Parcubacteria group bacterium GW2011_GWF2_38_76]HBM45951.1 DNA alkylation repair protein [Patescibacteria group bacterium]